MPARLKIEREVSHETLMKNYRTAEDPKIRQRLLMLIHVKEEKSATETAKMVKVSNDTVCKWVKRFNREGFDGLHDRQRPGRPPEIDYDDLRNIIDNHEPEDFGYPYEEWFPRLLYQYIVEYQGHEDMIYEYVYEVIRRAGYVLRVPRSKHYKQDEEKVRIFKKK